MTGIPKISQASQMYDPMPAWPLCGRIAAAPTRWQPEQGCPSENWGNPAATDFPLSSPFGPRQKASEAFRYDYHRGIDIPTPQGTPVFAITDGIVKKAGNDPAFEDPLVEIRHYRPGFWLDCSGGGGCYHSLSMHLSSWVVAPDETVQKGDLIGYTGQSKSGFSHLHFEIRDAPADDPFSAWQQDAIHPLALLPYDDKAMSDSTVTIDSAVLENGILQVQATVTLSPWELDLQRIEAKIYNVASNGSLSPISQPGTTPDARGYHLFPPWLDFSGWTRQWSHKDSTKIPWTSFGPGGSRECPFSVQHASSYDANLHLDQADPNGTKAGLFNGLRIAPAPFNTSSERYSITTTFQKLQGGANLSSTCIVVEATDAQGATMEARFNCAISANAQSQVGWIALFGAGAALLLLKPLRSDSRSRILNSLGLFP